MNNRNVCTHHFSVNMECSVIAEQQMFTVVMLANEQSAVS